MDSESMESLPSDIFDGKKPDILNEYSIKETIGRGTFSSVKLGENNRTKEKVAIKIVQKNKIINDEDLMRTNREIDILKRLDYHPNVIKIYQILEDSDNFYIIMEYCENGELFNRIVEKQELNEEESALFYYQIICGLEFIHKKEITHRDLKPENLLLTKDDILKISDFGLSNYSNNLLSTPCGSPCYASPEMVSGKKYDGLLIDIWSTGIILFAMLCGYLPLEDEDNDILFAKIAECDITYPEYVGELPLDLMKKILVNEPNKRINLNEIKEHPFYLKGKQLFNQNHPNFNEETVIDNKLTDNIYTNENLINKNNDSNNIEDNNLIMDNKNNDKQSNEEIINNNYKKDDSIYNLKSEEISMDSIREEINKKKENNPYINNNIVIKKKKKKIKDNIDINSNSIQKSPQISSSNTSEKNDLNKLSEIIEINLEDFNNNRKEIKDNTIKTPIDKNNDKVKKYKKRNIQNYKIINENKTITNNNSIPKKNYKNNNYTECKYPHYNSSKINIINDNFYKKLENIGDLNNDKIKDSAENNIEKAPNINHIYNKIDSKINLYKNKDINNNKRKILNKKEIKEPNNNNKRYNINNLKNKLENDSLSVDRISQRKTYKRKKTKIPKFNINKYKNYIIRYNIENDFYESSDRKNKINKTRNKSNINISKTNNNLENQFNKNEKISPYDNTDKNKPYNIIKINNNNNINFEPQFYIYVDNTDSNNNDENLKKYNYKKKKIKRKKIDELDKNNYNDSNLNIKETMNNSNWKPKKRVVTNNQLSRNNNKYIINNNNDNNKNNINKYYNVINHSSKNKNLLIDKNGNIYENLHNIEKKRINNNENHLKNNYLNNNDFKPLNNYERMPIIQKPNRIENKKYKYIKPKINNANNLDSFEY